MIGGVTFCQSKAARPLQRASNGEIVMTRSMTAGSPAKLILLFALPLFIGNLFQ